MLKALTGKRNAKDKAGINEASSTSRKRPRGQAIPVTTIPEIEKYIYGILVECRAFVRSMVLIGEGVEKLLIYLIDLEKLMKTQLQYVK